jgi:beta-galactosidase
MKNILSKNYFPFGSQYYRAPSPPPEDWERDIRRFRELGFNTIKFWVQWRWNHPKENEYYFEDIDRLMDIALKYDQRVMLNTIFDVAPAWIYRKYPDASMLTLSGRQIGPQTQPHRQIGGLGYCFNHDGVMQHFFAFLQTTVNRYKDHPALEIWNIGSEPELTSSMAEMRLYADNAGKMGDMLCYCSHCKTKFREWLRSKYGNIESLNVSWNRNYISFDDAELPKTRNTFNDLIDWRMFFVHTIRENVRRRFEVARAEDQGKHPLMCHHVFIQGFPVTSTASDPWELGKQGDLHGFTQMDDPMMCDILRCCARGKPVISAEMLMLMGYTLNLPKPIDANDLKRNVFSGIAANLKGFIFWQYRPELLGRESPTWGLTYLDGATSPWLESFSEIGRVLQKHSGFLLDAQPPPAKIAILYSPENQIFTWAATGNEKNATHSLLGYHKALYERNYKLDFIHPSEFDEDILDRYRVLILPLPYHLNGIIAAKVKAWVEKGGVLIAEAFCGAWNREGGNHHATVPGYGLHEVFKVRQRLAYPVNADNPKSMTAGTTELECAIAAETYFVEGADVLAYYEDGEPAVTAATFGNGMAISVGSYLGLSHFRTGDKHIGDFIASLVDTYSDVKRPSVSVSGRVRIDYVTNMDGNAMLILRNIEDETVEVSFSVTETLKDTLIEQFTGERMTLSVTGSGSEGRVSLNPHEVKVYYA